MNLEKLYTLLQDNVFRFDGTVFPHEVSPVDEDDISNGLMLYWRDEDGNDGTEVITSVEGVTDDGLVIVNVESEDGEGEDANTFEIEIFKRATKFDLMINS